MSRTSVDEVDAAGIIKNGYDYNLQIWVRDYKAQMCGHRADGRGCCPAYFQAGKDIRNIDGHEVRG